MKLVNASNPWLGWWFMLGASQHSMAWKTHPPAQVHPVRNQKESTCEMMSQWWSAVTFSELFLNYFHKGLLSAEVIGLLLSALALWFTARMGTDDAPPWMPCCVLPCSYRVWARRAPASLIWAIPHYCFTADWLPLIFQLPGKSLAFFPQVNQGNELLQHRSPWKCIHTIFSSTSAIKIELSSYISSAQH